MGFWMNLILSWSLSEKESDGRHLFCLQKKCEGLLINGRMVVAGHCPLIRWTPPPVSPISRTPPAYFVPFASIQKKIQNQFVFGNLKVRPSCSFSNSSTDCKLAKLTYLENPSPNYQHQQVFSQNGTISGFFCADLCEPGGNVFASA